MIPGVHYAPEVTLNILSIGLLRQQGSANIKREIEQPRKKENDDEEIGNFHRFERRLLRTCGGQARSSNPTGGYGDEGIRRFDGLPTEKVTRIDQWLRRRKENQAFRELPWRKSAVKYDATSQQ
ncbi:hypothetical protein Tco_1484036 [Tanacetum coccineum]